MKTLTRTIIVFIALNLITAGFALAQASGVLQPSQTPSTFDANPVQQPSATNISREQRNIERLMRSVSLSSGRRTVGTGNTVLVIPSQEIKTEEILTINEDINVMSRIFEKNIEQARIGIAPGNSYIYAQFPPSFLGGGRGEIQNIYLQGYGALFLMNVDFPLSVPPEVEKQQEQKSEKEDVDQVWEQTRQQIYEPQENSRRRPGAEQPEVKYDAEKVEKLKTTLIEALKHAANIRILKPDESVILSITGSGVSSGKIVSMVGLPGTDQTLVVQEKGGNKVSKIYTGGLPDDLQLSSPTVLVIRAKKSDIDSFAKGDLNVNSFRQRVQILSYPLLGENVAGSSSSLIIPSTGEVFQR